MKVASVSNGLHIEGGMLTALSGAVVAGIGALGVWLAQRLVGKAAWQNALNTGFKDLLDQLQEERANSQSIISALREERSTLASELVHVRQEQASAVLSAAAERAQLRGEIVNLTQVVEGLKRMLRAAGIDIPVVNIPRAPGEQVMIVLEQSEVPNDDA